MLKPSKEDDAINKKKKKLETKIELTVFGEIKKNLLEYVNQL